MRKWAIWIPVLMVAALLYWTVALGLGGLSLMMVGSLDADTSPCFLGVEGVSDTEATIKDSYEPITVNLVESPDPADMQDSVADPQTSSSKGPGATAF